MGINTHTAARIYKGQKNGKPGEESILAWEKFPYTGQSKTYNTDHQTPDSAGTATAIFSGASIITNSCLFTFCSNIFLANIFRSKQEWGY